MLGYSKQAVILIIVICLLRFSYNTVEINTPSSQQSLQLSSSTSRSLNQEPSEAQQGKQQGGEHEATSKDNQSDTQQGGEHGTDTDQHQQQTQSHYHHPSEIKFWINALIALILTVIGGFCSGMTVGLMSIQSLQLEMMSVSKDPSERDQATRILNVISNHHLFLVTLLLANAMALETLPLVVHSLMPDWMAILFSTFIVLLVAEIIPMAFCTGPNKITFAYYGAPIIQIMIKILWIMAYPIAKGLDKLLGVHGHQRIQHKDFANFLSGGKSLIPTQKLLLTSILDLRCERVTDIMVPIHKVYMLNIKEVLTENKVQQINQKDFSYILVYKDSQNNVVGSIKTKEFTLKYLKEGSKEITVQNIVRKDNEILSVYSDTNLLEMLMLFQAQSGRIALVIEQRRKTAPGILSIMYSKSEMISKEKQSKIVGAIFLYQIFEEIAEYHENIARESQKVLDPPVKEMLKEMQEMDSMGEKLL